jgi:hypothetical protein
MRSRPSPGTSNDLEKSLEDVIDYRRLRNQLADSGDSTGEGLDPNAEKSAPATMDWTRFIMADMDAYVGGGGYADVYRGKWANVSNSVLSQRLPKVVVKKFRVDETSMEAIGLNDKGWNKRVSFAAQFLHCLLRKDMGS